MLVENGYNMQNSSTNDTPTSHNNVFFLFRDSNPELWFRSNIY